MANPLIETQENITNPLVDTSSFFIEESGVASKSMRNTLAIQSSIIVEPTTLDNMSTPQLLTTFNKLNVKYGDTDGYKQTRKFVSDFQASKQHEALRSTLQGYLDNTDIEQTTEFAQKRVPAIQQQIEKDRVDPMSNEKQLANTVERLWSDDKFNKSREIANMYFNNTVVNLLDKGQKKSWIEIIASYGGFFLNDVRIDSSRIVNSSWIEAKPAMQKMILAFKAMPPHEQILIWPNLVKEVLAASDDNELKAVIRLLEFINPGGSKEFGKAATMDAIFMGVDVALIAPIFIKIGRKAIQGTKVLNILKRMKAETKAGKVNADAIMDDSGDAAKIIGTEKEVAATNAMPIEAGKILDNTLYTDNIAGHTLQGMRKNEQVLLQFLKGDTPLIGDFLPPQILQDVRMKLVGEWRTLAENTVGRLNTLEFTRVGRTSMDIVVDIGNTTNGGVYKTARAAVTRAKKLTEAGPIKKGTSTSVIKKDSGFVIRIKEKYNFSLSDAGLFQIEEKNLVGSVEAFISSPSYHLGALAPKELRSANLAELGGDIVLTTLNNMVKQAVKPIGNVLINPRAKARLKRVDQVLLQGDAHQSASGSDVFRGKLYTPDELRSGIIIPTKKGSDVIQLTEKEIETYYGMRKIYDWLYMFTDSAEVQKLNLRGIKQMPFGKETTLGKPFERIQDVSRSFRETGDRTYFNPLRKRGEGAITEWSSEEVKSMYEKGYQLVKFENPKAIGRDYINYAFVPKDEIQGLPPFVLNYKEGYVPKITKNSYYFVKETIPGVVGGVSNRVVRQSTLRIFDGKKTADAFVAKELATRQILKTIVMDTTDKASLEKGMIQLRNLGHSEEEISDLLGKAQKGEIYFPVNKNDIKVFTDREIGSERISQEAFGLSGGLFTSPRATHDILFGASGEVPKRYSAFESLQRNIQHVANYYPRNVWRIGIQQRWLNSAHTMGNVIDPRISNFREAVNSIIAPIGSVERSTMKSTATWIQDQARVPTMEEIWYSRFSRGLAEWAEQPTAVTSRRLPKGASDFLYWASQKDPFSTARALAFHPLLGWFNPAQLFVQAQGFSVALAVDPVNAMKGMKGSFGLTTVAFSNNLKYVKMMAKALGENEKDFVKTWQILKESGLLESIKTTADHSAAVQGHGTSLAGIRALADKGLLFYRRGEIFTRTFALKTALNRWSKKTGKNIHQITKDDIKDIMEDTIALTLNMFRANRAKWQRGLLSVPTQFMQIQAKWIEAVWPTLFGGKGGQLQLDLMQKYRFLLIQMGLYGAAGIPMGNFVVNGMADWLGFSPQDLSKETKKALNGGLVDVVAYTAFGADNEFGSRGAIVNQLVENAYDLIFESNKLRGVFGAFGQVAHRFSKSLMQLAPLVANIDKISWSKKEILYIASEIAKVTSTWNNASKAYIMFEINRTIDQRGNTIVEKDFNVTTIIGQAMGFRASDHKATLDLKRLNTYNDRIVQDNVSTIMNYMYNYLGGIIGGIENPKSAENVNLMITFLFGRLSPELQQRVNTSIRQKLEAKEDERSKQIARWFRMWSEDTIRNQTIPIAGATTNQILEAPQTPEE